MWQLQSSWDKTTGNCKKVTPWRSGCGIPWPQQSHEAYKKHGLLWSELFTPTIGNSAVVKCSESNIAVSERLGFSQSTVKYELQRITKRLRVRNRSEAVARAMELNLMSHQGEVKTPIATMNKNELSVESESASTG